MLTVLSIRAEEGRKRELDEEGRSSAETTMAVGALEVDSAGVWLKRARGGVETVDGKAAQLGARQIEAGWQAVAGAADGGDSARPSST